MRIYVRRDDDHYWRGELRRLKRATTDDRRALEGKMAIRTAHAVVTGGEKEVCTHRRTNTLMSREQQRRRQTDIDCWFVIAGSCVEGANSDQVTFTLQLSKANKANRANVLTLRLPHVCWKSDRACHIPAHFFVLLSIPIKARSAGLGRQPLGVVRHSRITQFISDETRTVARYRRQWCWCWCIGGSAITAFWSNVGLQYEQESFRSWNLQRAWYSAYQFRHPQLFWQTTERKSFKMPQFNHGSYVLLCFANRY